MNCEYKSAVLLNFTGTIKLTCIKTLQWLCGSNDCLMLSSSGKEKSGPKNQDVLHHKFCKPPIGFFGPIV